jgi:hypothetical protein
VYCCELLDRSKQAYYKKQKRDEEYLFRVMRIVDAVKQIREMDPGIGYYKLWLMMKRMFLCDWVPGRDSFLQLLRDFQLMQKRPQASPHDEFEPSLPYVQEPYPRLCADSCKPALGE